MIKKQWLLLSLFSCSLCYFSNAVFGQPEKTESRIDSVMKRFDLVGLSVAVVKKGDLIYAHSFGLKNKETNTALSNMDIFRIASISKSFSATSIMQLVE